MPQRPTIIMSAGTESGIYASLYYICFSFDFSLTVKSFVTYAVGSFFGVFTPCVSYQVVVQRYCIVKTARGATM